MDIKQELSKLGIKEWEWLYYFGWDVGQRKRGDYATWSYVIRLIQLLKENDCKSVLETGTFRGKTSMAMSLAGMRVTTIDINYLYQLLAKIALSNLEVAEVAYISANSKHVLPHFADNSFDAFYVDGGHEYLQATFDIKEALRIARKLVVVHDVDLPDFDQVRDAFKDTVIKDSGYTYDIYPHSEVEAGMGVVWLN